MSNESCRVDYTEQLREAYAAPKQLLFIDDDDNARELFKLLAANHRCCITEASCAGDAVPLVLANQYDLILVDIMLPGEDGIDLYQKIKSIKLGQGIKQRIVIISGALNETLLARMERLGCFVFVHKAGIFSADIIDEMLGIFGIEKLPHRST